jgi:hypothetical protein
MNFSFFADGQEPASLGSLHRYRTPFTAEDRFIGWRLGGAAVGGGSRLASKLLSIRQKVGLSMLLTAITAALIVFALFLSMLSSSPKDDSEWNPDTEA